MSYSFESKIIKEALREFGWYEDVMGRRDKYKRVADLMNYRPLGKDGKLLTIGGVGYKKLVMNELVRRFGMMREEIRDRRFREARSEVLRQIGSRKIPYYANKRFIDTQRTHLTYTYDIKDAFDLRDLYDVIKSIIKNDREIDFITLMFKKKDDNKVRGLTLRTDEIQTLEDFEDLVNSHIQGNIPDSDAYANDEYELLLDIINTSYIRRRNIANGRPDKIVFKCVGINSKKNDCGFECLKHLGYKVSNPDKERLRTLEGFTEYLKVKNINANIILNCFYVNNYDGIEVVRREIPNRKGKKRMDKFNFYKINNIACADLTYHKKVENPLHTFVYCELSQHLDIITNNIVEFREGLELESKINVCIDDGKKVLMPYSHLVNNNGSEVHISFKYVFFDYETIIDFEGGCYMKPYSLSILYLNDLELKQLEEADKNKDEVKIADIRRRCCRTFLGFDCNELFIEWLVDNQSDTIFCFVGFNNASFDNYIMLDGILRSNKRAIYNINISNELYAGNQLLNFKINGRHHFYDIHKHLVFGSLEKNCESFKVNCCAKKKFNHNFAQELYEKGELIDYINNDPSLKEYNEYDVLATAVLLQRYKLAITEIPSIPSYMLDNQFTSIMTIGSLIWKTFENHSQTLKTEEDKKKQRGLFGKLPYKEYKDILKYKVAGRVEMFNGVQEINEKMISTDVCSLYPYVMAVKDVYYPAGQIKFVDEYQGDDELGFYYCDIDQSNLRANNLPLIYPKKTETENNWGHNEILQDYLIGNVSIKLLKDFGCNVVIKKGFTFERRERNCDLFRFLLDMMKAKNEQDTYNKNGDERYNPALRETLKLLMNSLSGKVIEGLHTEKINGFESAYELSKLCEKTKVNMINSIGGRLYVSYEIDEEDIIENQRPVFLGCYVYEYARDYMYRMSYSKIGLRNLVYTDTDASKFRERDFNNWCEWINTNNIQVPHWRDVEDYDERYRNHLIYDPNSKVFGSFEDELEGMIGDNYKFYCLQKKSWCYSVVKDGKVKSKFRFKGLNGRAIPLELTEDFVMSKTNRKGETKFYAKPDSEYEMYKWCIDNEDKSLDNSGVVDFFNKLYRERIGYVLTTMFRKVVKNSMRDVGDGDIDRYNGLMNKVVYVPVMKKITIEVSCDDELVLDDVVF